MAQLMHSIYVESVTHNFPVKMQLKIIEKQDQTKINDDNIYDTVI